MTPAAAGIRTRELIYANRFGQHVWREPRGLDAGLDTPQFSIHRGKLLGVLLAAVRERLGPDAVRTGCRFIDFAERDDRIVARFALRDGALTGESRGTFVARPHSGPAAAPAMRQHHRTAS